MGHPQPTKVCLDLDAVEPLWLTRPQAAAYLTRRVGFVISAENLANRATANTGPPFQRWIGGRGGKSRGATLYRISDLDAWINTQLSTLHTAYTEERTTSDCLSSS